VAPLYTEQEALAVLEQFVPVPFGRAHELAGGGRVRFVPAGHILGAAIVELELSGREGARRITFSGDLGVDGARLLGGPSPVPCPDVLLVESTYGDRAREAAPDPAEQLHDVIRRTVSRGGKVVIPSFAVGRAQAVLAHINDLVEGGRLPGLTVYVDSPMAVAATEVFALHPEAYSEDARRLLRAGDAPLEFDGLCFARTVEESRAINEHAGPCVIISASGMCTAGRIKHHLRHTLADRRNTVLFVGYQAAGTLGRLIQDGTDPVQIFGEWIAVRASIATIEGLSAHADRDGLLDWCDALGGVPRRTYVVHGEERAAVDFAAALRRRFGDRVVVPRRGQSFDVN
jgi:metallo-beta-lactamase family protein